MLGEADQRVHYCIRHSRPARRFGDESLRPNSPEQYHSAFLLQTTNSVSLHAPLRRLHYTRVREHRTESINLLLGLFDSSYEPPITSFHIHGQAGKEDDAPQEFGQ
jgi:hypothetical protein